VPTETVTPTPTGTPGPPAQIPTMGTWAMITLFALLLLLGIGLRRPTSRT
jgi:hypothetical protein